MSKCITPEFRASYVKVFTPGKMPSGEEKYSLQMLFPKDSSDFSIIQKTIQEVLIKKFGTKENIPKGLKMPIRDGDKEEKGGDYTGNYFMNASSKSAPGVVDQKKQPIIDVDEFYSGCWAKAQVAFYYFDNSGNKGIGAGLHNLQKVRDDDRLDGREKAEEAFDELPTDNTTAGDEVDIFG
jgi:hypothetical protein